jgi:hypothetical protein
MGRFDVEIMNYQGPDSGFMILRVLIKMKIKHEHA